MACLNILLKKDEAIEASTSSSGVEEAFAGLTKSLTESRQKYEDDKASWEIKLQSSELALHEANKALTLAEESSKAVSIKLEEAERCKTALDVKLKEAERCKGDLEEKLRSSEELLRKEISSRPARKKIVAKKYFSAGWDKGWNKALTALFSQMEYARVKYFRDGWVSALQRLNVAENSEMFQEYTHGPPPSLGEEEEDEIASDESSLMVTEQVPDVDVPQSSEQLPQTTIPADQCKLSSDQPSTSSKAADDVVGNKEKV